MRAPLLALLAPLLLAAPDEHETVRQIHDRIAAGQHSADAQPAAYRVFIPGTAVSYQMVPVRAGEFTMGSPDKPDERPPHKVRLDAFWMQAHEVTWDEYRLFMFATRSSVAGREDPLVDAVSRPTRPYVEMSFGMGLDGYPAISMTQHAANKYAEWLSSRTGEFYRLPTEAEWEYACRAGLGGAPEQLDDSAWYAKNSGGKYQKAGTKKPNAWGLYDMLGNVMEWTLDQYAPYSSAAPAMNPWVRATEPYPHAVRGGSWNDAADLVRCSARVPSQAAWKQQDPQLPKSIWYHTDAPWLGFRLVRPSRTPTAAEMYRYWNSGVEHDEGATALFEAEEPHMGTLVRIQLYAGSPQQATLAFHAAFKRVRRLDEALSDYKPESELNRLCRAPAGQPVKIGPDLFEVLAAAQSLAQESGGAFDVTLGPVTRLWREARKHRLPPQAEALREAGSRCGTSKLHLDARNRTATLDQAGMQLDLGGIAKGYAADAALAALTRLGIRSALVAVSGDLAFSDAPPGRRGWRIRMGATGQVLELRNAAVSTSGADEQHLDMGGQRYSHIIDPATFQGVTSGVEVSVIAPRGALADGLATAISVLGADRGRELAKQHSGVQAFIGQEQDRSLSRGSASLRNTARSCARREPRGHSPTP